MLMDRKDFMAAAYNIRRDFHEEENIDYIVMCGDTDSRCCCGADWLCR